MEEEKKVVEAEVQEEAKAEEVVEDTTNKPAMEVPGNKFALIAFILAIVGFECAFAWFGAIVGLVLGIVGLSMLKKAAADRKPFSVFQRIAKPFAILAIVIGAIMFAVALIVTIVTAIIAVAETAETALVLFAL